MKHLVAPVADFLTSSKRTGSLPKRVGHVPAAHNVTGRNVERSVLTLKLTEIAYTLTVKPLTPELNPSAQSCLPRFFNWDFNF
jgi:hypothetical protein